MECGGSLLPMKHLIRKLSNIYKYFEKFGLVKYSDYYNI
ncbi:hypothetical protein QU7_0898 [Clostridioides difficile P46]|nr:hypothetical protein QU7_0898 [Clostridioides difficile P46]